MLGHSSLIVFVQLVFVFGALAAGDDDVKGSKQSRKLAESKEILIIFEYHFDRILQKSYPSQTFGPLYRESININGDDEINENTSDSELLEEYKKVVCYFYASTPTTTSINRVLANYHVTHIATWFKLNFQTCILFYAGDDKYNEIRKNCQTLVRYLETFTSITPEVQAYHYALFRKESASHVKATEHLPPSQADIISKRLKVASKVKNVIDPDIGQCGNTETANDIEKYCKLWMEQLIKQPTTFKLNHIFFDVYNGLKEDNYDIYDNDSYLSDMDSSIDLWNHTPQLLESVEKVQLENMNKSKITSYAVSALFEIIDFKLSKYNINPILIDPEIPPLYYPESTVYFKGDDEI